MKLKNRLSWSGGEGVWGLRMVSPVRSLSLLPLPCARYHHINNCKEGRPRSGHIWGDGSTQLLCGLLLSVHVHRQMQDILQVDGCCKVPLVPWVWVLSVYWQHLLWLRPEWASLSPVPVRGQSRRGEWSQRRVVSWVWRKQDWQTGRQGQDGGGWRGGQTCSWCCTRLPVKYSIQRTKSMNHESF